MFESMAGSWPKKNFSLPDIIFAERSIFARVTATSEEAMWFAASVAPLARTRSASASARALMSVASAPKGGQYVFVEVGAGGLRAAAARDVLGKRGAPHVAVAFDRRGADPWRQLLKMAATLISNGATGCQISGLYHPALLAAIDAQVNGPPIKKSVKAARKRIEINGRFRGMAADPLRRGSNSPGLPDNRLLATLKRIPTSSLSLVDLTTPGGTPGGSSTSLRELDER